MTNKDYRPIRSRHYSEDTDLHGAGPADSESTVKKTLTFIKRHPYDSMDDIFFGLNTDPCRYGSDSYAFKKFILGKRGKGKVTLPLAEYVCVNPVSKEYAYKLTQAGEDFLQSK